MAPDERDRVNELFEKLETLERNPRDPEAEQAIVEGVARAPHAIYPLVQTVLVQDEALKQADARIRELEAALGGDQQPRREGGFLDNMRSAIFGGGEPQRRGSVPSVGRDAPMGAPRVWGNAPQQPMQQEPMQQQGIGRGGSFLGTAAASAAGMIGGYMLMNSLGGMFGGQGGQAHAAQGSRDPSEQSQWGGSGASNSDLARDAGLGDMGRGGNERQGMFDSNDAGQGGDDFGGDFGGDGGGGE